MGKTRWVSGDVVRLKSGSPKMTVVTHTSYGVVRVVWIPYEGSMLVFSELEPETLEKVVEPETPF